MIKAFDPSVDELTDLTPADQIDLICDSFEEAWNSNGPPRIEDYLDHCDSAIQGDLLIELLLVDREFRDKRGESASLEDYLQRFPDFSTVIEGLDFSTINERYSHGNDSSPVQPTAASGSKFAHFELLHEIGSGASGSVWKARDTRLSRLVALKVPRRRLTVGERERFLREGQTCAQVRHRNIVTVYEVGADQQRPFIVTELVDGLNLRDSLKERQPTPREAAQWAAELAEALQHAHEQGVIHRDLKPANILIDQNQQPHITDFGLAKWTHDGSEMTVEGHILGTPAYMSPEQARGNVSQVDLRSDVYGLGALLYEMLTGNAPFKGEVSSILSKVVAEEPVTPRKCDSAIPRDLETICLKALQKDPARRYQSSQDMAQDLQRYLADEPILARRTSLLERSWRLVNRRKALTAFALASFAAVAAFSIAGTLARKNHDLMGYRRVTIATNPPGAHLAFVPLSKTTGEPEFGRTMLSSELSPVKEDLVAGDYLVVAVMEDGRFHEVFRHVPDKSAQLPGAFRHRFYRILSDGVVELPTIDIPSPFLPADMVSVDGQRDFAVGVSNTHELPLHLRSIASFWIDTQEFTFGRYKELCKVLPTRFRSDPFPDDTPMSLTYDEALSYAEKQGKRLPTEFEYEFIASRSIETPIDGLVTGKAEWTSSWAVPYPSAHALSEATIPSDYRVVRGGDPMKYEADPSLSALPYDPHQRMSFSRHRTLEGVGFRCVRSAEPAIPVEAFQE